ncbi:MAG: ATP-dependent Clp protease proteolytic subunit [Gemmatimonadota bacterium]|nr:MAG: ATP-dependent Clp protease proteolytic subunit [Gemmatimonadota bacterium]
MCSQRPLLRVLLLPVLALALLPSVLYGQKVYRIPIEGTIDRGLGPFVKRSLEGALEEGARFAVLDINTPGGRVDAAWQIVDAVQESPVPVYAFVDRALSAGAMIALAADDIYVRPGATLGAATPVIGSGEKASEKMVSAMRSEFRALAEARGLDPRIAEAMVDEEIEVAGVVEAGKLLTLSADEAVSVGYARAEVATLDELLVELGARNATVVTTRPNWAENIVRFLTNPVVAPLLLSLGFLGLLFEVKTPGFGVGGLVGLIGLGLFFGAHLIVGLAGLEELMLIGAGLVLVALEVFVIPGFGVAGALGIVALGAGVVMSMLGRFPTLMDMGTAFAVVGVAMALTGAFAYAFLRHLKWTRRLGGIFLRAATTKEAGYISGDVRADLVGHVGVAATALRPAGVGIFGDERIDVVSEGPWIEEGSKIEIMQSEGYRHVVREVRKKSKR